MKYIPILLWCCITVGSCSKEQSSSSEAKVRPYLSQVVFSGGISLTESLNPLIENKTTIRKRREALRPPLLRIYEVLKSPEIARLSTVTIGTLATPLSEATGYGKPALAEMLLLSGFDAISLASQEVYTNTQDGVAAGVNAIKSQEISPIGIVDNNGAIGVIKYDLPDVKLALVGLYLSKKAQTGSESSGIAAFIPEAKEEILKKVTEAFDKSAQGVNVRMVVVGADKDILFESRQQIARALIDSGINAVLGDNQESFEGIEAWKKGIIVYNPGICYTSIPNASKTLSFIFKLHFDKNGVQWIESQPIIIFEGKSRIGMGKKETHYLVDKLIAKSKSLNTVIINEHGRGIWESSGVIK